MTKEKKFEKRFSAGGVIFRKNKKETEVLVLIHEDKAKKKNKKSFVFPKGTIEENEDKQETAKREIKEECGLETIRFICPLSKEVYWYKDKFKNNVLVRKEVDYYLYEFFGKEEPVPQKEEGFIEALWLEIGKAKEKLTYENGKEILAIAEIFIARISKK